MHFKKLPYHLFVVFSVFFSAQAFAQPPNDDPCKATFLGPLPQPVSCPVGKGPVYQGACDNTGAKPEYPHPSMMGCSGNGKTTAPNADVWFEFISTGRMLNVTIRPGQSGDNIDYPQVSLYEIHGGTNNDCLSPNPLACAVQNSGTGTVTLTHPIRMGAKYLIQVAGKDTSDTGAFQIDISNDLRCYDCQVESDLLAYPSPVLGRYQPGQYVTFIYFIKGYKNSNGTSPHALIPRFGPGWDTASFIEYPLWILHPLGPSWKGTWMWYKNKPTPSGVFSGYFYDMNDTIPSNNIGDKGTANDTWYFFWQIKTKPNCSGPQDLSVQVDAYSDGETGVLYPLLTCQNDPSFTFKPILDCCPSLTIDGPSVAKCPGGGNCNDTLKAYSSSFNFSDFKWYDDRGTFFKKDSSVWTSQCTTICPGKRYTVISYNKNKGCLTTGSKVAPGLIFSELRQIRGGCGNACADSVTARVTNWLGGDITSSSTFLWSNSATTSSVQLCPGKNWVCISNNGCTITDTIDTKNYPPDDAYFSYPEYSFCKRDKRKLIPNYVSLQGGSFTVAPSTGLTVDAQTGEIDLNGSVEGSYTIVYTTNDNCSASDSVQISITAETGCDLSIYKGFTPNGDGFNDGWIIDGVEFYPGSVVKIFNRWGGVVWESTEYDNLQVKWEGKNLSGGELPDGTYFYYISLAGIDRVYKGWVELTR